MVKSKKQHGTTSTCKIPSTGTMQMCIINLSLSHTTSTINGDYFGSRLMAAYMCILMKITNIKVTTLKCMFTDIPVYTCKHNKLFTQVDSCLYSTSASIRTILLIMLYMYTKLMLLAFAFVLSTNRPNNKHKYLAINENLLILTRHRVEK